MGSTTSPLHHHKHTPPLPPPSSSSCCCAPSSPSSSSAVSMEPPPTPDATTFSYSKFNSALNAGLLNPMSPPLLPHHRSTKPTHTLFEMMATEQDPSSHPTNTVSSSNPPRPNTRHTPLPLTPQEQQLLLQERVSEIMGTAIANADIKLTLTSRDALSVTLNVHRHVLVAHSRFFASKLSLHRSSSLIEISDCDDVLVYAETIRLMYSDDRRRCLLSEDVLKVLSILKVCAAVAFDDGVLACLEYLEAAPWAEDEEEKVAELLSQLQLDSPSGVHEVLRRVSSDDPPERVDDGCSETTVLRLLRVVLEGKDEKARRDMKGLLSKMLRESHCRTGDSLSQDSLYSAFDDCLHQLRLHVAEAAAGSSSAVAQQIARQADNLHWILDILIDRQLGEDCLLTWAGQTELSAMHDKVPMIHRCEMSRVTARLFIGIGKGQVLVPREIRWLLLRTWLQPFYEDFGWMRRSCKGLDRHSVEDGLASTMLTLPLALQQELFLAWFERFLSLGDEYCPNLQRGFEVWWRRMFWRRRDVVSGESHELRVALASQSSGAGFTNEETRIN